MSRSKEKNPEEARLAQDPQLWQRWGPFVAERSWGTVREDYSENGTAWDYFPFTQADKKAYRWGEDGLAAWCDRYQVVVFAPSFWNGKDPILKERLFGLASTEGNHGEDVKEIYFHLDALPTHSYMKYLYRYPQAEFPYQELKEQAQRRTTQDAEFEILDTGVFDEHKFFDVEIEYCKIDEENWAVRYEITNQADIEAPFHLIQQIFFRNQWSWEPEKNAQKPEITELKKNGLIKLVLDDEKLPVLKNLPFPYKLGKRYFYAPKGAKVYFTENETGLKEGVQKAVIHGDESLLTKESGSKAGLHYNLGTFAPGEKKVLYFTLRNQTTQEPFADLEELFIKRRQETIEFYKKITPSDPALAALQKKAISALLWTKQIYLYDVHAWLKGDNPNYCPPESRNFIRNQHWHHLNSMRIMIMPDKWEYPYFCAWDQAFHTLTLALVDREGAKEHLWLLLFDQFQHPNGEIPACEWEFSDKNPPVQAWAALKLFAEEKKHTGQGDRKFLEMCFHKLLMNFAWWVNKVDSSGNNIFEGGFLGLDNITIIDRSLKMLSDAKLEQSDGTAWMALFCLNMMNIALLLAEEDAVYESLATKFFQHFVYIASAMKNIGGREYQLWSEEDGFFYDVLTYPDGKFTSFRVRSFVGIIPLFAVSFLSQETIDRFPAFKQNLQWFLANREKPTALCVFPKKDGYLLSLVNTEQLKSVLNYLWNPAEFLSPYGIRSLSKFHLENPFHFEDRNVGYEAAESLAKIKGGNSNWRGPVWLNMNYLLLDALREYSDSLDEEINLQEAAGKMLNLEEMVRELAKKLLRIFITLDDKPAPFWGADFRYPGDPLWKDHTLFYEYYHGDTGKGLGASHQTGWSALVANIIAENSLNSL